MNTDSLGLSELKWTRMGEFSADNHYIYYCGQKSLRRNGVAIIINKRAQDAVQTIQYYNDPSLCPNH